MAMKRLLNFEVEKENKYRDETNMIMEMEIKTKVKAERNKGKKATFRKLETKNVIKCKIPKLNG